MYPGYDGFRNRPRQVPPLVHRLRMILDEHTRLMSELVPDMGRPSAPDSRHLGRDEVVF
jgi:hypothetical protein